MNDVMEKEAPDINERRVFNRFSARFPAKIKDSRDTFGSKVYLRNASAEGVQLSSKEQLFVNDSVALEVNLLDGTNPLNLRGEIVWAKKASPNIWDIGLRFHKVNLVQMSRLYKFAVNPA